jgi:cyclopropane-fatty-acyl-phospholipid synthase
MMSSVMYKTIVDRILRRATFGSMTVTYPDNSTKIYGNKAGALKLHLVFHSSRTLRQMVFNPSVGMGEGYARGEVTFKRGGFAELITFMERNQKRLSVWAINPIVHNFMLAGNTKSKQRRNISHHYDVGNDFYKLWLDRSMTYSCAYFMSPKDTLERAQRQKVDYVLKKLNLLKGQTLLDIGSGWGTLLIAAAKQYGVSGLGVTLSQEQFTYSNKLARREKVDHLVRFELTNYQDLVKRADKYDRIVSVGMFEHVGRAGMRVYFDTIRTLLKDDGVSVLHTISASKKHGGSDAWIDKYIFPGGYIPAIREIFDLLPDYGLVPVDYESLRLHYARTVDEWHSRYMRHEKTIRKQHGEFFFRSWEMYLASCAASFRAGGIDLSQFILTKGTVNDLPMTREYLYRK